MTILIFRSVPGLRARWTPSLLATLAFSFLLLVLVPSSSSASAIYSYTGNYYTAFEDPVFPVETIFTASAYSTQTGQPFHGKLDTNSTSNWTV